MRKDYTEVDYAGAYINTQTNGMFCYQLKAMFILIDRCEEGTSKPENRRPAAESSLQPEVIKYDKSPFDAA